MSKTTNISSLLPAIIVGLAVIASPLLALTEPVDGDETAAIFPPGWSQADVLLASARADQSVIRFGALPNIGIIRINDSEALARLRREGAIFLLPPGALGGCLLGETATLSQAQPSSSGTPL